MYVSTNGFDREIQDSRKHYISVSSVQVMVFSAYNAVLNSMKNTEFGSLMEVKDGNYIFKQTSPLQQCKFAKTS